MRWLIVLALSVLALGASAPAPTVTGPIPVTAAPGDPSHNYPFFSTRPWLDRYNYEEEEFYVEGLANEYAITPNQTATIATGGPYPYKTRVIVRRPKSADKFNGTVILEWINVTPMHDFEIDWSWSHEHLTRRGFVHIGASVQSNGIDSPDGLKKWNPARYGSLNVTANGKFQNDQLSFSIYSQIARAIKDPSGGRLVGNLRIKNVVATGHSQSAGRLTIYYNSIHPLEGVIDGFVLHGGGQSGPVRTDLRTPAWKLLAETDVLSGQAAVRQPDSEYFRTWEVAGASHGDFDLSSFFDPLRARDVAASAPGSCERPILSRVPAYLVQNAVYDHMKRWVENGKQPPSAPRITMSSIGKVGTPADRYSVVARDENGNALGGIRLAQVAVPTATNTGLNEGPGFCRIYGSHEPFDAAKIARLYPTRAKYITEVNRITDENLAAGYITEEGAAQTKREAADRREH
jgi:Alpha/beta hydrolase domain